eukprot:4528212-Lingulodinium_polyedra.AAC.1
MIDKEKWAAICDKHLPEGYAPVFSPRAPRPVASQGRSPQVEVIGPEDSRYTTASSAITVEDSSDEDYIPI